jgi:hypothetical protein
MTALMRQVPGAMGCLIDLTGVEASKVRRQGYEVLVVHGCQVDTAGACAERLPPQRVIVARSARDSKGSLRLCQHGTVTQAVCKQARRRSLVAVAGDTASRSNTHVLLKAPKWWTRAGKRGRLGTSYLASHSFHPITSRRYGSEVHGKHLTLLSTSLPTYTLNP